MCIHHSDRPVLLHSRRISKRPAPGRLPSSSVKIGALPPPLLHESSAQNGFNHPCQDVMPLAAQRLGRPFDPIRRRDWLSPHGRNTANSQRTSQAQRNEADATANFQSFNLRVWSHQSLLHSHSSNLCHLPAVVKSGCEMLLQDLAFGLYSLSFKKT
jgi:hypothetical protein